MAIHHIILLKFEQGIAPADVEKMRMSLYALPSQIPAIHSIKAGRRIKHPLDRDFDQGVILIFKDEAALKEYIAHKAHREYQEYTAPYIQDKLIFDIDCEE